MSTQSTPPPPDEEPIPKLPRAPLFRKLSMPAIVRIGMFGTLLYAVIVMRKPCADGVGRFVTSFEDSPDAGSAPTPGQHYSGYELMTAEEALKRWPDSPKSDAGPLGDAGSTRDATPTPDGSTKSP